MMHYPMLLSGMHRMQADIGDSRLNNYLLEHSWLWVTRQPGHDIFWSPAFYYPQPNVAGYSDLMLGFAPFYWCWRLIGLQPDTAFQWWMLTGTTFNYFIGLAWLRCCFRCTWTGSIVGSVFLAAAGSRATQLGHQQLQWIAFPLLAMISLYQIFAPVFQNPRPKVNRWWILMGTAIIAQFWGGFYNGWFLILGISIAGAVALTRHDLRTQMFQVIRRDALIMVATTIATTILLAPLAIQYLDVKRELDGHGWNEIVNYMAKPSCWFLPGPFAVERLCTNHWFKLPEPQLDAAVCMGTVTSCICVIGLWHNWKRPQVQLLAFTSIIIGVAATKFGQHSLWHFVHHFVPAADAIRCPSRIGLLLTIPAALGLAQFVSYFSKRHIILAVAIAVCLLEQICVLPSYDKKVSQDRILPIVAALPPNTHVFYFVGYNPLDNVCYQIDAMWAGLIADVPTINGYSGARPHVWVPLFDDFEAAPDVTTHDAELRADAATWEAKWALDPSKVVWLKLEAPGRVVLLPSLIAAPSSPLAK
jgi:hypothetical protein